jgi:hypothetical protein
MKFEVSFPTDEPHIFTRTDVHGIHQGPNIINPKFVFGDEIEMEQFQAYIRERKFLGAYVAAKVIIDKRIWTAGQFIKVWQTDDDDQRLTFTFWATKEAGVGHWEFDVAGFASISRQRGGRTVRFKFKEGGNIGFQNMIIDFKYESGKLSSNLLSIDLICEKNDRYF